MSDKRIGERYVATKKVLRGDPLRGLPELWKAEDAGDIYYAKLWKRRSADLIDLGALWNREVRGLARLQGFPGANELFVRLQDMGVTPQYYYTILDTGHRMPLSDILSQRSKYPWLRNLAEMGRRRPLWEGLSRIAEGLGILHSEGTLHRSLSTATIFASHDGQGDFRLSGFEWSLRIAGSEGAAAKVGHRSQILAPEIADTSSEYSTATDWFDFGLLAAELFGANFANVKKVATIRAAIESSQLLRTSEKHVILQLLEVDPEKRLSDSDLVLQSIRNILQELNVASTSTSRPLTVAVRLGQDRNLSKTIESLSSGEIVVDAIDEQLKWIRDDLRGDIRVIARVLPSPHFILRGKKLDYRIRPWTRESLTTWDVGFCENTELAPRSYSDDQYFSLGVRKLEILSHSEAARGFQKVRDRSAPWDKVFSFKRVRTQLAPYLRDVHDFFRITQQLDTVLTAAQICPVKIIGVDRSSSYTEIAITPQEEPDRNELAGYLKLAHPSEQLRNWFDIGLEEIVSDTADPGQDKFQLLERRTIATEPGAVPEWRFVGAKQERSGPVYRFRSVGSVRVRENITVYLARNYGGTIAQIRRRHRAIEDMRSHEALLRLLADPRGSSRRNADTPPPGSAPIDLDPSKLQALVDIWRTQPSFAVQGPPGTGKTTLIRAVADRLFSQDPSAQVLVTAHSHHTVDDVRGKLSELFLGLPRQKRPIFLRLDAPAGDHQSLEEVTKYLGEQFAKSELAKIAPSFLKDRIAQIQETDEARTLQLLVRDAANLTFATSNSGELARLASGARRFDWSIIEEAGKAHGFDMAIALEESHRLLLIGDHFQLPPYNTKVFTELLGNPLRVRKAIQTGAQFAPGLVDPSLVEEDPDLSPFEDRCAQWRRMVTLFAVLFERSVNTEQDVHPAAATLTDQHRMHPDIADLVGRIFYPDEKGGTILKSPEETVKRFESPPPYKIKSGSWLPEQRVVWCDVPWIQKHEFSEGERIGLFAAPKEAQCVVKILEELEPRDHQACELQILSPYNDQLGEIRLAITAARKDGRLNTVFGAPFDLGIGKRIGATVDEFQGSEADIVIVSLVRNNPLVPWKSIGFLKEPNRMNVLLSRARQKLIVVGSWDFFSTRCTANTSQDEEFSYIGRMMNLMEKAQGAGALARVGVPL